MSSCDSSSISSHSADENDHDEYLFEDDEEWDYHDDDERSGGSPILVMMGVAQAVEQLNRQTKLERVAAAAIGLGRKMIRPNSSRRTTSRGGGADFSLQSSTRVQI